MGEKHLCGQDARMTGGGQKERCNGAGWRKIRGACGRGCCGLV